MSWTVVLSLAKAEWQVYRALLWQSVDAYYPFVLDDARYGRWLQPVLKPQFPGYLFAKIARRSDIETIRKSIGVRDLLRSGQELVMLSEAQFREIKTRCDEIHAAGLPKRAEGLTLDVGEIVQVPFGPFVGAPAIVRTLDKAGRIEAQLGPFVVTFNVSDLALPNMTPVRGRPWLWSKASATWLNSRT